MSDHAAMFLFLGATIVAVFAFFSILVWVTTPAQERRARDRIALLKALAENPGENAREVLALLREEDSRRAENRQREDRKGWFVGGLIFVAVGAGLGIMLATVGEDGAWTVALIPLLVGCVLLGGGSFWNRPKGRRPTG